MSVALDDHRRILKHALQVCESHLYQRFHADVIATRQRVTKECSLFLSRSRASAERALSSLSLETLPSTPRRTALAAAATSELDTAIAEQRRLEDVGHQAMVSFMQEKQALTEQYEALYEAQLAHRQHESQQQLRALVDKTTAANTTDEMYNADASADTSTAVAAPAVAALASNRQKPLSPLPSAIAARARDETASAVSSRTATTRVTRPASAVPTRTLQSEEKQPVPLEHVTPSRLRPRTAQVAPKSASKPATKPALKPSSKSAIKVLPSVDTSSPRPTSVTASQLRVDVASDSPTASTTPKDLSRLLDFDSGVDALLASLNAALHTLGGSGSDGGARYQLLPEYVKGDLRREPGRTRYARRVAREAGRASSKVSRALLIKARETEAEFARRRVRDEEERRRKARLLTPKGSPAIIIMTPTPAASKATTTAGNAPTTTATSVKRTPQSEKHFFPSHTRAHSRHVFAAEAESQALLAAKAARARREAVPLLTDSGDAIDRTTLESLPKKLDYAVLARAPDAHLADRLREEDAVSAVEQARLDRQWSRAASKGAPVDNSVALYLNSSTSSLDGVHALRRENLTISVAGPPAPSPAGSPATTVLTPQAQRHAHRRAASLGGYVTTPTHGRPRPLSRERAHARSPSVDRAAADLTPDILRVSSLKGAPVAGRSAHVRSTGTLDTINDMESTPTTARAETMPPLNLPDEPNDTLATVRGDASHANGDPFATTSDSIAASGPPTSRSDWSGVLLSHRDSLSSYPASTRASLSPRGLASLSPSRSLPQLSHRALEEHAASTQLQGPGFASGFSPAHLRKSRHRPKLSLQLELPGELEYLMGNEDEPAPQESTSTPQRSHASRTKEEDEEEEDREDDSPQILADLTLTRPRSASFQGSPSASDAQASPERVTTPSAFKSRPTTGLKLSFSIPSTSRRLAAAITAAEGGERSDRAFVWPERGEDSENNSSSSSSGLSSDSTHTDDDDDAEERREFDAESPSARYTPSSMLDSARSAPHPLGTADNDAFSDMLDSLAIARETYASYRSRFDNGSEFGGGGGFVDPDEDDGEGGPTRVAYTVASLRSTLSRLREEVSSLRETRNFYRRELDVLEEQQKQVDHLVAQRAADQETALLGYTRADRLHHANSEVDATPTGAVAGTYTSSEHQLNVLHFRRGLYGASKDAKDATFLLEQLEAECAALNQRADDTNAEADAVELRTAESRQQRLRESTEEQTRAVALIRRAEEEIDRQRLYFNDVRHLSLTWSRLHGVRDAAAGSMVPSQAVDLQDGGVGRRAILPECFRCHRNLLPTPHETRAATKTMRERRERARERAQAMSLGMLQQTTSSTRPATALPAMRSTKNTASTTSIASSTIARRSNARLAAHTEWSMLEGLGALAAEMRSGPTASAASVATRHRAGVFGVGDTSHERARLVRERTDGAFTGGHTLRPTSAVLAPRGRSASSASASSASPPTAPRGLAMSPEALAAARQLRARLIAREYVRHAASVFVHVPSCRALCRACRYELEANPARRPATAHPADAAAFAPDQRTMRFFARRMATTRRDRESLADDAHFGDVLTPDPAAAAALVAAVSAVASRPPSAMSISSRASSRPISAAYLTVRTHLIGQRQLAGARTDTATRVTSRDLLQRLRDLIGTHDAPLEHDE